MLRELHISNLAVIQDVAVELDPGLNCFTGQTGAGKSLVIGALEILLGLRQPQEMLRKGAAEGRVSGVFQINSRELREQLAQVTDLALAEEPELIISRRIFESGRTSSAINGNPITGQMLKQVGETLVDVHGQHDAQYLLKPGNQLAVIDEFGGAAGLREEFAELFRQRQGLVAQREELTASRTLRKQQLELYEFQAKEIDEAELKEGEQEELHARHKVLRNLEKIKSQAGAAYGALYEEEGAVIERLRNITGLLLELTELDVDLGPISTQVKEAAVSLDDAAFTLRRYVDRLELDPAELTEVGQRLNLVNRMVDKYAGSAGRLDEVLAYRAQIGGQIEELRRQDVDYSSISEQIAAVEKSLKKVGGELTRKRAKAAEMLGPRVHAQLADLGMKEAKFFVEFTPLAGMAGDAEKPKRGKGQEAAQSMQEMAISVQDFSTASGLETVELMIAPNPGQPARPLRRIASGGELSRVMLALKSILAQADRVSVLVFDEIDANVGGRMGTVIGEKLRDLAKIHQVLCITHLPQIAAFADRHLTIRKQTAAGEAFTTVTTMQGAERVQELAEMISGKDVTATSLAQARELLGVGQRTKIAKKPTKRNI